MSANHKDDLAARGQAIRQAADALAAAGQALAKVAGDLPDALPSSNLDIQSANGHGALTRKLEERLSQIHTHYAGHLAASMRLSTAVESLFESLGKPSPGKSVLTPAATPPDRSGSETGNFVDFLTSVGDAVLQAQRQLDSRSRAYIGDSAASEFVVPTAFRIPKLTGKMLFQLEFEKKKGVQLVFHSDAEKATRLNQQSIEFDIVSVPAPPGAASAIRAARPSAGLVLDDNTRSGFLEAARASSGDDALPPDVFADPLRLVLLERRIPGAPGPDYLALYAGQSAKPSAVGMWLFSGGKVEVIYKFTRQNGPFEDRLKPVIAALADAQAAFLTLAGA